MTFQEGHEVNLKLKTDELKKEAYRQYCDHISQGWPQKSWCFEHPTLTLTWESMEKYIKDNPSILDPIHKKVAQTKSLKHWFSVLSDMTVGKNTKGNIVGTQIILRNMHAWDAKNGVPEDSDGTFIQAQELVMKQLASFQLSANNPQKEAESPNST